MRVKVNSIRVRLTLAFAAAATVLIGSACLGLVVYGRRAAERDADHLLDYATNKVRREALNPDGTISLPELQEEEYGLGGENMRVVAYNLKGQIISQGAGNSLPAYNPYHPGPHWYTGHVIAKNGIIYVALYRHLLPEELREQELFLIILSTIAIVAATLGAHTLIGKTLMPIALLARQAEAAGGEDLSVRLQAPSQDAEIQELVHTLNGLLVRLGQSANARSRFYSAASHELRTPLQALSGHLELAGMRPRSNDEYREILLEARAQTDRLVALVRDLLVLNRLETAPLPPAEPVELNEMCQSVYSALQPVAASRQIEVSWHFGDSVTLGASPNYVGIVLRNILENALKYAREGGEVIVSTIADAYHPRLQVYNECTPLEDADLGKLFDPFFRPDRSRNSRTGGNGLGLAICRAIANASGWQIFLEQDNTGVTATIVF